MKNHYFSGIQNVGDELNRYLWPALLGDDISDESDVALLGIGTLLNEGFCQRVATSSRVLVMGTGAGYGDLPRVDERWTFYAVRGPRTCKVMGLDPSPGVADSAYLLGSLDWRKPAGNAGVRRIGVVPHHSSLGYIDWERLCQAAGLEFVSPELPVAEFLDRLNGLDLVLAEAMHAAILADVLRVRWVPFRFGQKFHEWKWFDWGDAFQLRFEIAAPDAFYDPDRHWADRGLSFHAGRALKKGLAGAGIGPRKWGRQLAPGWPKVGVESRFVAFLRELAGRDGYLSEELVFQGRVEELYRRLERLGQDVLGRSVPSLTGNPRRLFGSVA